MDLLHGALIAAAGFAGGIVATVVGGGSLVTYPVLIGSGIPPLAATISTNVAFVPSAFVAAMSDRTQLPPLNRDFALMALVSVLGSAAGALLLLVTPERLFEMIVPALLGFATILFALSDRISAALRDRAARKGRSTHLSVSNLNVLLPVSVYGGYFGSGVGILLLGVLSVATGGNYRAANVAKNLVASLNNGVAAAIYIVHGDVLWSATIPLMAGAIAGGVAGSWIARIMPRMVIKVLVVAMGAALTATFVWRYWL